MSQIKAKQIQLVAQGDLIVGNSTADGSVLSVGTLDQVLVSNGTTPLWGQVGAGGISLTEGDVFIGDATNTAAEASATSQGQVIISGAGPNFNFAVGSQEAQYVIFAPNTTNNISAIDTQSAIIEVAAERAYIHTDSVDPTANNDGVDSAALGETFKIGDLWINTITDNIWHVADVSTGAAVWVRSSGVASAFVYKGDVDASNTGILPGGTPVAGDWYRVSVTGGTQNFNAAWDASGEPNGATFNVGDAIVFGDDGNWHKIDNTDPTFIGGDGVIVGGGPTTFTLSVDADETTITASGGTGAEIAVYGGLVNQALVGQGAASDATWNYMDNLYDSGGNIILDGVGSATPVNHIRISSADTLGDVSIASVGTDLNVNLDIIAKGLGRISLDGTLWPNDIAPARSLAMAEFAGDLKWITAPDASGDQVLRYNDTTNSFEWVAATTLGGPAWSTINGDSGVAIADTTQDTLNITGGVAIITTASNDPEVLTIDLDIPELTTQSVIDAATDLIVFYDASAGAHRKTTINNLPGGGGGEANTASNIGTAGIGVFKQKTGVDLEFKNINAGSNKVTITDDIANNEVDIDIVPGNILTSTLNNDTNWAADQNLWATITADAGSTTADTATDTVTISGGAGISTSITGDNLTITNDAPNVVQNLWATVVADSGTTTANIAADTLTISGGANITTAIVGDTLTITGTSAGADVDYVDATALGSANEVFTTFFANTPTGDGGVTVFFNGLALRKAGWSRTGTNLTLVDAINGYATEAGDIISSRYEF